MKASFLTAILTVLCMVGFGQDTLIMKDHSRVVGKVKYVGKQEIVYRPSKKAEEIEVSANNVQEIHYRKKNKIQVINAEMNDSLLGKYQAIDKHKISKVRNGVTYATTAICPVLGLAPVCIYNANIKADTDNEVPAGVQNVQQYQAGYAKESARKDKRNQWNMFAGGTLTHGVIWGVLLLFVL